ncbi:ABC transporter substrate-binding protein [Flavobacterium sp. J49]|uniref:ABC transporter substrate-binding protein n=1 Tax=Flavobacterium sp. J49 TaxID=2718534 RepID=UPI001593EE4D|nr:helical backbone metal receptor [Flavobacterium sp. J49]MBF6640702.1 ABC transporter substrate-binding protein [Flavobacterium sp. J49]NIC01949.1 ABC transporter substrate-binding protein [Flavobacterium sp. J49]
MKTFTDQLGKTHSFEIVPKRIVSLVPSQTELLYDLGLEENIVGITKFCVHPFHFKSTKKIIGGTKKVHFEKIRLLQPDIIIANKEENTIEIVEELSKICPVWVTDIITLEDNLKMIADFGTLFNKRTEARKWIDKINFAHADFQHFIIDKPVNKVAYFIWANPYMVASGDTFINELLKLNKFENIYDNHPKYEGRYPEVIIQKMRIQGDPDLVLLSSEPFPFTDEHAFELGRFTHHAKTVFVDGEMFSWYGSRIVKAFGYFKILHEKIA